MGGAFIEANVEAEKLKQALGLGDAPDSEVQQAQGAAAQQFRAGNADVAQHWPGMIAGGLAYTPAALLGLPAMAAGWHLRRRCHHTAAGRPGR